MTNVQWLDLVGRAQQRDPIAESELFDALQPEVNEAVRKEAHANKFVFEEAVADSMTKIFLNLAKFKPQPRADDPSEIVAFTTWAKSVAKFVTKDLLRGYGIYDQRQRQEAREARLAKSMEEGRPIVPGSPKPKDLLSTQELMTPVSDGDPPKANPLDKVAFERWLAARTKTDGRPFDIALADRIEQILRGLPEKTKEVFELRLDGMSHDEIAARVGITSGNSRVRFNRAMKSVRQTLGIPDGEIITRRTITNTARRLIDQACVPV